MTKRILVISIFTMICATSAIVAQTMQEPHMASSPSASPAQKYTCVMHPEVVMDHPGKCPRCGMTLVPLKENRKRSTLNVERPTTNAEGQPEHAIHNADGMAMPQQEHAEHEMQMSMHSSVNLADSMNRESSGTSWIPDS